MLSPFPRTPLIVALIAVLFIAIFVGMSVRGRAVRFDVREMDQPSPGREGREGREGRVAPEDRRRAQRPGRLMGDR